MNRRSLNRVEKVIRAAKAIEDAMSGETRWNATIVADRLLSKGYVIRHAPSPALVKWAAQASSGRDATGPLK